MDAPDIKPEQGTTPQNESAEPVRQGCLRDDLNDALKDTESTFSGSFYHSSTDANAPNPGLSIEGLGLIGLPLNHREAQMIISRSTQAPFGKGAETVVDTKVRDTWEIDPSSITFSNPRWQAYVDHMAFKMISVSLGVAPYIAQPRCELYKMLLYQPGSHFLPHQDTAKAPGMFATIVVVLPSAFQGGEVHVSHSGVTKILDVSQSSAFDTSFLAWYTDVMHEVKPITAGYRLALSYNLVHTAPNIPAPSLPGHKDMSQLRNCLEKWNADRFETTPETPLVAYLLAHQYSANDLDNGQECLKGRDANTVAQLLPLAESLNIVVCLGNLTRTVTGIAEDYGYDYHRRGRWYDESESDEDETPCMGEIEEDDYKITNMARIDAGDGDEVNFGEFAIDQESLIPEEPFDGADPDDEDYEGYMGNGAGSMSQWYRSSVLILIRRRDVMTTGISLAGYDWGLQQLHLSPNPDPKSEQIVTAVLNRLEGTKRTTYTPQTEIQKDRRSAQAILRHAVAWRRPELWNKVISHCGPAMETAHTYISEALNAFSLESIKPGLAQIVNQSTALQVRFDIIKVIAGKIGPGVHSEWVEELAKGALSSYRAAAVADVPMLVEITKDRGVGIIEASILPHIAKTGTYDFLMALAKALRAYSSTLEESSLPSHETRASLMKVIRQCLTASIPQWQVTTTAPGYGAAVAYAMTNRLSELLDFCFAIEDFDLCKTLAATASKTGNYDSRIAFAKTLHGHLTKIPQTDEYSEKREEFGKAIRMCISAAISSWQPTGAAYGVSNLAVQLKRASDLLPFCFDIGQPSLCVTFFNAIRQSAPYELLVELSKTLNRQLPRVQASETDETGEKTVANLHKVVRLSLETAAIKWEAGISLPIAHRPFYLYGTAPPPPPVPNTPNVKTNRICEFLDQCFALNDMVPCVTLFNTLLQFPQGANFEARFNEIFVPLIPQLRATLAKHGKTIVFEPFASFFRSTISLYLSRVLAPRTPSSFPITLPTRTAGCNICQHCNNLKAFLSNTNTNKDIQFSAVQSMRTHIETEIRKARIGDIVTTETIRRGSPHTLLVTKRPEFLAQVTWRKSQADAAAFVRSVGEDGEVKRLMPDRHNDVVRAVQGTKTFVSPATLSIPKTVTVATAGLETSVNAANLEGSTLPPQPVMPLPTEAPAGSSSSSAPLTAHASAAPTAVAGTKRKNREPPKNTIAVIDLT